MEVQFSQKIKERYPTMRLGLVEIRNVVNSGSRELRDERRTVERIVKKEYRNWEKVDIIKAYDKFFGRHDRPFPIVEGVKAVLKGKGIPTLSPLVDAMLLAELKHLVLMTAHDLDKIDGTLTVDQAMEGDEFVNIAGDTVPLEQGDVVIRDRKGVIGTYLEGQSLRTKVTKKTRNCAYFAFYVPGVKDVRIKNCLKDAAKMASLGKGKPSDTELHIVGKAEVKTGVVSTERINPWGEQKIRDYDKLLEEFGLSKFKPMVPKLPNPIPIMQRGIVFSHRDFSIITDAIKKRKPWVMMTGLMPSGKMHFGNKMVADQIIYYQSIGAKIYLCVADIEAYNMRKCTFKELKEVAINEYLLNYIALGLKPENVDFYFQSDRHSDCRKSNAYYRLIGLVSKKPTMNEMKAIYGELTPGKITSIMTQVADILHPMLPEFEGRVPVVVPVGIDQDPHLRLTRDIANRIKDEFGFMPPASTYNMFMKGLKGGKMASSDPGSFIALSDPPKAAAKKLSVAFTGGRGNAAEQRKKGANPDVCTVYDMYAYHVAKDARHLEKVRKECKTGKRLCGECKKECSELLTRFLTEHQKKREKAKKIVGKFLK
ncbi:MAG: tryptophan--tRNA ligase [Candidatus Aenigmarchaeota archaeon]